MLTALIVEDERHIFRLISKLVDWSALNISLIGHCENGRLALEFISSRHPDIIITDIRMPGMTGLELIRRVREQGTLCDFIVISGFRDFEYARTAMSYGVEEYLLKPVNAEELTAALTRISARVKDRVLPHNARQSLFQTRRLLRNSFMDRLTTPSIEIDLSPAALREQYHLLFRDGFFQAMIVSLANVPESFAGHLLPAIVEDLRALLDAPCFEIVPFIRSSSEIMFLMNYEAELDILPLLEQAPTVIQACLDSNGSWTTPFVVGIGLRESRAQLMRRTFVTARRAACCGILYEGRTLYLLEQMRFSSLRPETVLIPEYRTRLRSAAENLNTQDFMGAIAQGFAKLPPDCDPEAFVELCHCVIDTVLDVFPREDADSGLSAVEVFRTILNPAELRSLPEAQRTLTNWAEQSIAKSLHERRQSGSHPIREAKAYISAHYMEPLSLDLIAAHVHLNPSYFSICFKRETGQNFSNYLADFRVEAAKRMLRDGSKSVAAVCEAVGYTDSKYFSKIFTRIVGVTPSKYKSLHG